MNILLNHDRQRIIGSTENHHGELFLSFNKDAKVTREMVSGFGYEVIRSHLDDGIEYLDLIKVLEISVYPGG